MKYKNIAEQPVWLILVNLMFMSLEFNENFHYIVFQHESIDELSQFHGILLLTKGSLLASELMPTSKVLLLIAVNLT